MPEAGPTEKAPERIQRHGQLTGLFMGCSALVLGGYCGLHAFGLAIAAFARWDVVLCVAAAAFVPFVVYAFFLLVRSLRGYTRPTVWSDRLLSTTGTIALLGVVVAFAAALAHVQRADLARLSGPGWFGRESLTLSFALIVAALPAPLAAHELGHLVAARAVGFAFETFQLGPIRLDRAAGRWRAAWKPLEFGLGGSSIVRPGRTDRLRWREAAFGAGGPAANLLLALLAGLAAIPLSEAQTVPAFVGRELLGWCALQAIVLGVLSLLPASGPDMDGLRVLRALRPRPSRLEDPGGGSR